MYLIFPRIYYKESLLYRGGHEVLMVCHGGRKIMTMKIKFNSIKNEKLKETRVVKEKRERELRLASKHICVCGRQTKIML